MQPDSLNPLSCIVPEILANLRHLNLTIRVVFRENKVVGVGAYGDICKASCTVEGRGKVVVAIKRLRFYLKEDIKTVCTACNRYRTDEH